MHFENEGPICLRREQLFRIFIYFLYILHVGDSDAGLNSRIDNAVVRDIHNLGSDVSRLDALARMVGDTVVYV